MHLPRTTTLLTALVLGSWATPLLADRLAVRNGGFERVGDDGAPARFEVDGAVASVVLPDGAGVVGRATRLEGGAALRTTVAIEPAREVERLDRAGWYLCVSFDVLERSPEARLELLLNGSPEALVEVVGGLAPSGGPTRTRCFARPAPSRVDPGTSDAAGELTVELRVFGGPVLVDDLRVERFHTAPSRAMRGKENGVNGPDQLGCGALGFTGLVEHEHAAFAVLNVQRGGAAERAGLERGDLVVAIDDRLLVESSLEPGWDWFERSHEAVLGRALESAALAGRERVALTVLRADGVRRVAIEQPFVGARYGADLRSELATTFPLRGALSDALHRDLVAFATHTQRDDGSWPGAPEVTIALGGLALLGTQDTTHRPAVERALARLRAIEPPLTDMPSLAYWSVAYQGMFLCEWHLSTGDESVLPWVESVIAWLPTTTHTSAFGMQAFGHGPDGLPYEDKALMAPAAHLLVFEALARRCGVHSNVWEHIRPYVVDSWSDPAAGGHGGMGYNGSYKDTDEFWSRSGLVALAEWLRGDTGSGMAGPLCALMEERHPWMFNSHAYGEPGAALGLLALAGAHPAAFQRVLPQWRWRFLCSWEPGHGLRYSTPHMGAPYMAEDVVVNLAYLLLLSVENRGLVMTGRSPLTSSWR